MTSKPNQCHSIRNDRNKAQKEKTMLKGCVKRSKRSKIPKLLFYGKGSQTLYKFDRNILDSCILSWIVLQRLSIGIDYKWDFAYQKIDYIFKQAVYKGNIDAICVLALKLHDSKLYRAAQEVGYMAYNKDRRHIIACHVFLHVCEDCLNTPYVIKSSFMSAVIELEQSGDLYAKYIYTNVLLVIIGTADPYFLPESMTFGSCWEKNFNLIQELIAAKYEVDQLKYKLISCIYNFFSLIDYNLLSSSSELISSMKDSYVDKLVDWIQNETQWGLSPIYFRFGDLGKKIIALMIIKRWVPWGTSRLSRYPYPIQQEIVHTELCLKNLGICKDIRLLIRSYLMLTRERYPIVFVNKNMFSKFCHVCRIGWGYTNLERKLKTYEQGLRKYERNQGHSFGDIYGILLWDDISC